MVGLVVCIVGVLMMFGFGGAAAATQNVYWLIPAFIGLLMAFGAGEGGDF